MKTAPFHADLARAPKGGTVLWRSAADGIRLRLGYWVPENTNGTVFLFPGRTESLEKYGTIIADLNARNWAVLAIDWRGQGLSDRLHSNPNLGHIPNFDDYQKDVQSMVALADELALPGPRCLLAHSMGGCIGLRALLDGLKVSRAVFSAPMWGLELPAYARPLATLVPPVARLLGFDTRFAPSTGPENYVLEASFKENRLTNDAATYDWLRQIAQDAPELSIGGPSIQWVGEATRETRKLRAAPRPSIPCKTFLGTQEDIVSSSAIQQIHENWSSGDLQMVEGAKHEVMMEAPAMREVFLSKTVAFLEDARDPKVFSELR